MTWRHLIRLAQAIGMKPGLLLCWLTLAIVLSACQRHETPAPNSPQAIGARRLPLPGGWVSYQNPAWSPDGRFLAFDFSEVPRGSTRGSFPYNAEIYVMEIDTGQSTQLTDNGDADVEPDWSPDGSRIVFVRANMGAYGVIEGYQLITMARDGSDQQVLLECPGRCRQPIWSPDGRQIAFDIGQIWIIQPDGTGLRQVSGEKFADADMPTWSPDGSQLAYWASLEPSGGQRSPPSYLGILNLKTGEERILVAGVAPENPRWSPDGTMILFTDIDRPDVLGISYPLYVVNVAGGTPRRLITENLARGIFDAVWSPDGTTIAFAYGLDNTTSGLYILDLTQLPDYTTVFPTATP